MDHYIFVTDIDSNSIFKDNNPYQFKVQFPRAIQLDGNWKVALTEIDLESNKPDDNTLLIYSNICKESIVNGGEYSLLRRIQKNGKKRWQYQFSFPFYFPVKKFELHEIEFVIKTSNGELATFLSSPTYVTLHIKQYPFYMQYESL